jgi:hypothetical protein
MNRTVSGSKTKSKRAPAKTVDSIRFSELDSNEIDKSDVQYEKHEEQRTSMLNGIITCESQPRYRINLERDESTMNDESTMKFEFPASIEIEIFEIFENAEPSIKPTSRGIAIDLRAEPENASDSMRFSREPFSNEIDESDWQHEKHDEQRTSAFRGTVIDLIHWRSKECAPMCVTRKRQPERGRRPMTE